MSGSFARRIGRVHRSFITEIFSVTENPEIISFAGGIPRSAHFPIQEISEAAARVLAEDGQAALQYTTTPGYLPLRKYLAERYDRKYGLGADPAEIIITNGSQQAFDLIGKLFLEPGDRVVLERPAYHGALQGFSIFEANFTQVPLLEDGIDIEGLRASLE